ncbi:MAG: M4 family metallopeptidase [Bacteroidota bacterium]
MRMLLCLCIPLLLFNAARGQQRSNVIPAMQGVASSERNPADNTFKSLAFSQNASWRREQSTEIFRRYLQADPDITMQPAGSTATKHGITTDKYTQYYKGIKVALSAVQVLSKNGFVSLISANYYRAPMGVSERPELGEAAALAKALATVKANRYMWQEPAAEKSLKAITGNKDTSYYPKGQLTWIEDLDAKQANRKLHLAYAFNVYAIKPLSRDMVYVDAHTGEILFVNPMLENTAATGTSLYSGSVSIQSKLVGGSYVLQDDTRGGGINTYTCANGDGSPAYNVTSATTSFASDAAIDAHWGAEKVYDYWLSVQGRNSFDNAGAPINSFVHYLVGYNNAFWDGYEMVYGDGTGIGSGGFSPLTSIDVCAHEIGHAVCQHTADLIYTKESGAMNEGFSDIWGAVIENYANPFETDAVAKDKWKIGEEISSSSLRRMDNPNLKGDPDTYGGTYWVGVAGCTPTSANDYCGVHTNSGVLNYWFYLLCQGGTGTNDIGSAYSLTGIGIDEAADIAYQTELLLTSTSDYANCRTASISAATAIYGACSPEVIAVTKAWYAVGVGANYSASTAAIAGASTLCTGSTTVYTNATAGGTWSSSNTAVATTGSTGLITGVAPGVAVITYAASCGGSVTKTITVSAAPAAITGTLSCMVGTTTTLENTTTGGTWTSTNTAVATIGAATGIVTGLFGGNTLISYTTGGCAVTAMVTVNSTVSLTPAIFASDTVEVGDTVEFTTNKTAITYSWNFGAMSVDQTATPARKVFNGSTTPAWMCMMKEGNNYHSFLTDYNENTIRRFDYGTDINSTPTVTNLGGMGLTAGSMESIDIVKDEATGTWYGVAISYDQLAVLTFGSTLTNTPTSVVYTSTDLYWAHQATIKQHEGHWMVFVASRHSIIARFDFGSSLSNTPTSTVIPNVGGVTTPCNFSLYQQGSEWYMIVSDLLDAKLVRYNFGTSLLNNTPTGTPITSPSGMLTLPRSVNLFNDCPGHLIGYVINETGNMIKMDFGGDITNNPVFTNMGASGTNHIASASPCVSNDSINFFLTNFLGSVWRYTPLVFSGPTNINYHNPAQTHVFADTGIYDVSLFCDMAYNSGPTVLCKSIVVRNSVINGVATVCTGNATTLSHSSPGGTWSSHNTAVATVSSTGVVTAVAAGTTDIRYLHSGGSALRTVTVNAPVPVAGAPALCIASTTAFVPTTTGGTWSSSHTSVATVGPATGVVTGVSTGTSAISYNHSGCITTSIVNVSPTPGGISGTPKTCIGSTATLANAMAGGTWSSTNTSVASIDASTGVATGVAAGTTTISYSLGGSCYRAATFTVNAVPAAIGGTLFACVGNTALVTNSTSGGVSWISSNTAVATVGSSSGVVTGVSAGTATITYTVNTGCYRTATFTVNSAPGAITGTTAVCAGSATALSNATTGGTWTSGATSIATVGSSSGIVTGMAGGAATITYNVGGCRVTTSVSVSPIGAISGTTTICGGSSATLSNTSTGGTWSSSNTAVATVGPANGVITGVAGGTAIISYTIPSGCSRMATVTVAGTVSAITGALSVCPGRTTTLTNATTGGVWSGSIAAIATINSTTGVLTGVGAGTLNISYTIPGGCRAVAMATVNALPGYMSGALNVCKDLATTISNATAGGTWISNNTAIATIGGATGIATGVAAGTTTITYQLATGCYRSASFTVKPLPAAIAGSLNVCTTTSTVLSNSTSGGVAWATSNPSVATVGAGSGLLSGVSAGTSTITYIVNTGCYSTAVASVHATPSAGTITGPSSVIAGSTILLSNAATGGVWSSSNAGIAGIDAAGTVTGVSGGIATISYSVSNAGCTVRATKAVSVLLSRPAGTIGAQAGTLQLYPNPTTGSFTIDAPEAGTFAVYTLSGQEVSRHSVPQGTTTLSLANNLAAGVYMCRYYSASGNTTVVRLVYER